MTDPTDTPETQPEPGPTAGLVREGRPCRWPTDGYVPSGSYGAPATWPQCGNPTDDGGTEVLSPPGVRIYRLPVCLLHKGDAFRAGWRDAYAPPPPPEGLTLDGINTELCKALGVDPAAGPGFRLTVLGGEFPALEVFKLPPMTGDGMFAESGPIAIDDLIKQGARIVAPHLALTEFTLGKLLEAEQALVEALSSAVYQHVGRSVVDMAPLVGVLGALAAGLSGWREQGAPPPAVLKALGVVDEGSAAVSLLEDPEADVLPPGEVVELYAIVVNREPTGEPTLAEHDGPVTDRPATYDGTV
jgi:hypothetical protein